MSRSLLHEEGDRGYDRLEGLRALCVAASRRPSSPRVPSRMVEGAWPSIRRRRHRATGIHLRSDHLPGRRLFHPSADYPELPRWRHPLRFDAARPARRWFVVTRQRRGFPRHHSGDALTKPLAGVRALPQEIEAAISCSPSPSTARRPTTIRSPPICIAVSVDVLVAIDETAPPIRTRSLIRFQRDRHGDHSSRKCPSHQAPA